MVLTSRAQLEELRADPVWGSLPAIKNNKVYIWTEEESWFRDPIALLKQTQDLANWIIELNTEDNEGNSNKSYAWFPLRC